MTDEMGLKELISISQKYGKDSRYVIAGGGNTSYKSDDALWVKASGYALATITEDGFAKIDRRKLNLMTNKKYSDDSAKREEEVKNDLMASCITKDRRPSVETSMHNIIDYAFVVHLHPTLVNGVMCSMSAKEKTEELFGSDAVYVQYIDPGYTLFKEVATQIEKYRSAKGICPKIIFLQNHGIFISADTIAEIENMYKMVFDKIESNMSAGKICECDEIAASDDAKAVVASIEEIVNEFAESKKILKVRNNSRISKFANDAGEYKKISAPFTPDGIVYCKSKYVYLADENNDAILSHAKNEIANYVKANGFAPKVILVKGIGLIASGDSENGADIILDVYEDAMKIAEAAQSFGGEHPMTPDQIHFIDNWEVENYRRKVSATK